MADVFNCLQPQVTFQEVPDEVSLTFTISGCPLRCEGCHSEDSWDAGLGEPLDVSRFEQLLARYRGFITCVLFFGGEWQARKLALLLEIARKKELKTCLYTGKDKVPRAIRKHLNYLKTGRWQAKLGGLDSPITNQRFICLDTQQLLNFKFIGAQHASL